MIHARAILLTVTALLMTSSALGQAVPKESIELWRQDREMYVYWGEGNFSVLRSCRQRWLGTEFDSIAVSASDSTISLRGTVYNTNVSYDSVVPDAMLLVGRFVENAGDSSTIQTASVEISHQFKADSSGHFQIVWKIAPEDYLCVVSAEGSKLGTASADIYNIGKYFSELTQLVPGDGPYVLIQPDSSLQVLQICRDSLIAQQFSVANETQFSGLCGDSAVSYAVQTEFSVDADSVGGVQRLFAVSDIHGEYKNLFTLLLNAGIIDYDGHWRWWGGHLVVDGDIFDRGDQVTECLWFLYRLESEAKQMEGGVHVLLGNHELMVLRGDYRYVNDKYIQQIEAKSGMTMKELYGPQSVLGRWLRSKNSVIKLDSILFVHGGLAPSILEQRRSISEINSDIRRAIGMSQEQLAADSTARFLLGSLGPLWYRGYVEGIEGRYEMATEAQVDSLLTRYGANTIVVGHTEGNQVRALYGGKVVALDVPTDELGSLEGLLWVVKDFYRIRGDGHPEPLE